MNNVEKNIKSIPKLLRSIADSRHAIENKHDIIFNEAANLIEHLEKIRLLSIELIKEKNNDRT